MFKLIRCIVALQTVVILVGCATTSQLVDIKPDAQAVSSAIGHNHMITVTVLDKRPNPVVGNLGPEGIGGKLIIRGDLPTIIQSSISNGLIQQGFSLTTANTAGNTRELRVDILNLTYRISQGIIANTLQTVFVLRATCAQRETSLLERVYFGQSNETILLTFQDEETNSHHLNIAISKSLSSLFEDKQLSECLAG